jgi:hypothetical protein
MATIVGLCATNPSPLQATWRHDLRLSWQGYRSSSVPTALVEPDDAPRLPRGQHHNQRWCQLTAHPAV